MPYIKTFDRDQMMMCSWDSFVAPDSTARIIDAFVNSLNMDEYGVKAVALEGRPSYAPKGMFKLYIYGYKNAIRSSRKLAKACCKQQVFSSIFRQFISSRFRQSKTSISYSLFIPGDCSPGCFVLLKMEGILLPHQGFLYTSI